MKTRFLIVSLILSSYLVLHCMTALALDGGPRFVSNQGQWEEQVLFRTDLPGGALFVEDGRLTYLFHEGGVSDYIHPSDADPVGSTFWFHAYQVIFENALPTVPEGLKREQDYYNFYLGNDPLKWASRVPVFKRIKQNELYPGIDLLLYNKQGSLKYDLMVAPGANPEQIQLAFEGVDDFELINGALHIKTQVNEIIEQAPFAYQLIDGELIEIACNYQWADGNLSFDLGEYSTDHELIIDPELSFASYSGSTANNFGFTATDDNEGNLYAGSIAYNPGYPTTLGAFQVDFNDTGTSVIDIGITKFSDDGSQLLYSTYLGGSGQEMPHSIIVNSQQELIVMGNTGSFDFPQSENAYDPSFNGGPIFNFIDVSFGNMLHSFGCDIFVSKFSVDGTVLNGSTYVGGTANDGINIGEMLNYNYGDVFRGEVIVDAEDNIIVASVTSSSDFPVSSNAAQGLYAGGTSDAVVFSLSPDLSTLRWSTFFGGSDDDSAYSVQVDENNKVFLAGGTKSTFLFGFEGSPDVDFNGMVDGFLVKYNEDGSILEGFTYVGTVNYEQCYFVQLDNAGNAYVIGQTGGFMPVSEGKYSNENGKQFIQKYNNTLTSLEWSTVFGTGNTDIDISPCAFLVSECDQIYVSGWGGSTNNVHSPFISNSSTTELPVTDDAFQPESNGSDFYLMVLSPDAEELIYATFFGGQLSNEHVDGGTSKFDKNGSVYQAVCAGCGGNDDFPTTPGVWSQENNSSCNLGVFKFDLAKITANIDINGPDVICEGQEMQFENGSNGGENFIWYFGDEASSQENSPSHTYESPGLFEVTLVVTDDNDCVQPDSASVTIEVLTGVNPMVLDYDPICEGGSLILQGVGTDNAHWSAHPTLTPLNDLQAQVSPNQITSYYFVDSNECETDSILAQVDFVTTNFGISEDLEICVGETIEVEASGGGQYNWSPSNLFNDPNSQSPSLSPTETITLFVEITSAEGCSGQDSTVVTVINNSPGGEIYDPAIACYNTPVALFAEDGLNWSWSPTEFLDDPNAQTPLATVTSDTWFSVDISNACGFGTSQVLVEVQTPEAEAIEDQEICIGEELQLWADGGVEFAWSPRYGLNDSTLQAPIASPPVTTTYEVFVTTTEGCTDTAQVVLTVYPLPEVYAGEDQQTIWYESVTLSASAEGQFYWSTPEDLSCVDCLSPQALPYDDSWFILESVNEFGCRNSDSVFVEILGPLWVPNSFSPNWDGVNDVFLPRSIGIEKYQLQIFNRWGELLFETTDLDEGWNGGFKRQLCPPEVYVWKIIYTDPKKGDTFITGHVTLLR